MAFVLPSRFSAVLPLNAVLLLGGCCANSVCDCQEAQQDAVTVRFSTAFRTAELDTITLLRYPKVYTPATKPETVRLFRTAAQTHDALMLNHNTPFAQVGTSKLNQYRYVVQYRVEQQLTELVIDSVGLRGGFEGTGCCTCYTNSGKTIFAKDSAFNLKQRSYFFIAR